MYTPINTNEHGTTMATTMAAYSQRAIIVICTTGLIIALNIAMLIAALVTVHKELSVFYFNVRNNA